MKQVFKFFGYGLVLLGLLLAAGYRTEIPVTELEATYFTPQSKWVTVGDAHMHIRTMGQGPVVFLIHGSFASLHTWQAWQENLQDRFTTISVDLPAHGLTGPVPSQHYSTDDFASLMLALADTLRIDTFAVAGNSMGGQVAWKMALHHPERVKKLVLVDAAGPATMRDSKAPRPFIFRLLSIRSLASMMSRITPRFVFEMNLKAVYADPTKFTDDIIDRYYYLMRREGNRDATLQRLQQRGFGNEENINSIHTPTLILWGEQDAWIPLQQGKQFEQAIQGSRLITFPNAGHVPMEEIPAETVAAARQFLLQ